MHSRLSDAPPVTPPISYWEDRARRYAMDGEGLAAMCSYGMPRFYNRAIQLCQRLALRPWLKNSPGTAVLDVGCGVGRWSRMLAAKGALVTGIDLSPTMVAEATRRAAAAGLSERCRFLVQDLAELNAGGQYELIVGVTVLQHILDEGRLRIAVKRLSAHLAPAGRIVLLEAAPTRQQGRCDSGVFRARDLGTYLKLFADCGLSATTVTGVDPVPFKTMFLPHYSGIPRVPALLMLFVITALSLPLDTLFGRRWTSRSWHKVFVLSHAPGQGNVPRAP
ncbi:MAG: SAM-dependent methyltransferase [Gammaproteobacteria bacterium]